MLWTLCSCPVSAFPAIRNCNAAGWRRTPVGQGHLAQGPDADFDRRGGLGQRDKAEEQTDGKQNESRHG